jgi:hypothetical protein
MNNTEIYLRPYFNGEPDNNHYIKYSTDVDIDGPELIGYDQVAIGTRTDKKTLIINKDGIKTNRLTLGVETLTELNLDQQQEYPE